MLPSIPKFLPARNVRRRPKNKLVSRGARPSKGMSLATILCMAVIITMFVGTMFGGLMSVYRKVATLKYGTTLRSINEAALDYMLDKYNAGQVVTEGVFPIANSITNDPTATTTITVTAQNAPPTTSILYDPNANTVTHPYKLLLATTRKGPLTKKLQVLLQPIEVAPPSTPTCIFALFGAQRVEFVGKSGINSYNSPDPLQYADIGTFGAGNQVGTGATARGIVMGGNQFEFPVGGQFQAAVNATMQTYNATPVAQANWAQIMGNVHSNGDNTPQNSGYWPRSRSTAGVGGMNQWNNVFGSANGTTDPSGRGVPSGLRDGTNNASKLIPYYDQSPTGYPPNWGNSGNVASDPQGLSPSNPYTGGRVNSYMGYTPPALPPAPLAPSGSVNLGNINISGTGRLIIQDGATAPTGAIGNIASGQTRTIPPGDYQVSTLNMADTASIQIEATAGNTRLFFNPPPANTGANKPPAISMGNSTNVNMSYSGSNYVTGNGMKMTGTSGFGNTPSSMPAIDTVNRVVESQGSCNQLQIYTNSVCDVVMAGNARAFVDAPNATVNIGGQGSVLGARDANFYGAVVAGVARVISDFSSGNAAWMHYDAKLNSSTTGASLRYNDPWAFSTQQMNGTQSATDFRAVTWQEI